LGRVYASCFATLPYIANEVGLGLNNTHNIHYQQYPMGLSPIVIAVDSSFLGAQ